jgi:hypothetical protein
LVIVPVTGLPPQVTVQSTPALLLSPVGVMLSFAVPVRVSELTVPVEASEAVIEIGPALAPVVETPPQPATIPASARPAKTNIRCFRDNTDRSLRPEFADFAERIRVDIDNMTEGVLFLSAQS